MQSKAFHFFYDFANRSFIVEYPQGTRPDTKKREESNGGSIDLFPSLKDISFDAVEDYAYLLPSIGNLLGRSSDEEVIDAENNIVQAYNGFKDEDYPSFSVMVLISISCPWV